MKNFTLKICEIAQFIKQFDAIIARAVLENKNPPGKLCTTKIIAIKIIVESTQTSPSPPEELLEPLPAPLPLADPERSDLDQHKFRVSTLYYLFNRCRFFVLV